MAQYQSITAEAQLSEAELETVVGGGVGTPPMGTTSSSTSKTSVPKLPLNIVSQLTTEQQLVDETQS
jgi:hypothetical protein